MRRLIPTNGFDPLFSDLMTTFPHGCHGLLCAPLLHFDVRTRLHGGLVPANTSTRQGGLVSSKADYSGKIIRTPYPWTRNQQVPVILQLTTVQELGTLGNIRVRLKSDNGCVLTLALRTKYLVFTSSLSTRYHVAVARTLFGMTRMG